MILRHYLHLLEAEEHIGDWPGRHLWHGTGRAEAKQIIAQGLSLKHSQGGYFGFGCYLADDPALAQSNYADFAAGEADDPEAAPADAAGVVLEFTLTAQARILDLRDSGDWDTWKSNHYDRLISHPAGAASLAKHGVDGVYDRSFGGICLYNPKAVRFVRVWSGVVSDALSDAINHRLGELDEVAIGGLRRCTAVTADALLKHFGKPGITLAQVPETDLGVLALLNAAGLAYRPAVAAAGRTVQQFAAQHRQGAWYLVSPAHAMALVDAELFDAENRGPDGRKLVQAYGITRR